MSTFSEHICGLPQWSCNGHACAVTTHDEEGQVEPRHQLTSKFLSLVLRHKPETIGIALDDSGWVGIEVLLHGLASVGCHASKKTLSELVANNDKRRGIIENRRTRAN